MNFPNWCHDANEPVPEKFDSMAREYGEAIRKGEMSRTQIMEATGVSVRAARTLRKLCMGETPHSPPGSHPPVKRTMVRPKPSVPEGMDVTGKDEVRDKDVDIDDMIRRREAKFIRLAQSKEDTRIRKIRFPDNRPVGICHMGDPHIDDDGCNWPRLKRALDVVKNTDGMYAGNVGDTTNNWVGYLERLYQKQETTYDQALELTRWYFQAAPHAYFMMGNHDKWNHGEYIMRDILRDAQVAVVSRNEARIEFRWPCEETIRLVCRHDFKGHSQWNKVHGAMKASKFDGGWGDIYVQGHKHTWAANSEEFNGKPITSIIVRGFKWFDDYAETMGFKSDKHGEACVTILDPLAERPTERVRVIWDAEEGAELLTWLRARRAA